MAVSAPSLSPAPTSASSQDAGPGTPSGPPAAARTGGLDGLRGAAAVGIVLVHVWMFTWGDAGRPERTFGDLVVGELRLGVPLFFALSGFLVYRGFAAAAIDGRPGPRLRSYARRRAARILPAYWVVVLASAVGLAWIAHPLGVTAQQLPVFLALGQNYFEATAGRLDPPLWTIVVEASFYAALPVFALLAGRVARGGATPEARRRRLLLLVGGLFAGGIAVTALFRTGPLAGLPLSDTLPIHVNEFAAGMVAAVLVHGRRLSIAPATGLFLVGAGLVVGDAWWHVAGTQPLVVRQAVGDVPATVGFAAMIAALAAGRVRGSVVLERGPLRIAGVLSFGLYLWHYPVIYALRHLERFPEATVPAFALVLSVSGLLATASWLLLEKPAIAWAARTTRRAPARERRAPLPAGVRAGGPSRGVAVGTSAGD